VQQLPEPGRNVAEEGRQLHRRGGGGRGLMIRGGGVKD